MTLRAIRANLIYPAELRSITHEVHTFEFRPPGVPELRKLPNRKIAHERHLRAPSPLGFSGEGIPLHELRLPPLPLPPFEHAWPQRIALRAQIAAKP